RRRRTSDVPQLQSHGLILVDQIAPIQEYEGGNDHRDDRGGAGTAWQSLHTRSLQLAASMRSREREERREKLVEDDNTQFDTVVKFALGVRSTDRAAAVGAA